MSGSSRDRRVERKRRYWIHGRCAWSLNSIKTGLEEDTLACILWLYPLCSHLFIPAGGLVIILNFLIALTMSIEGYWGASALNLSGSRRNTKANEIWLKGAWGMSQLTKVFASCLIYSSDSLPSREGSPSVFSLAHKVFSLYTHTDTINNSLTTTRIPSRHFTSSRNQIRLTKWAPVGLGAC